MYSPIFGVVLKSDRALYAGWFSKNSGSTASLNEGDGERGGKREKLAKDCLLGRRSLLFSWKERLMMELR
jgi:hypothetical protein